MKKNVLLITADHMRSDALACNGNPFARTPNLDALAEGGVTFRKCFTPNPICVPARASITTGNYSHFATGIKNNSGLIHNRQNRIAHVFADAGYETYAIGKLHYVPYAKPDEPRLLHGFQHAELCEEGRMIRRFSPFEPTRGIEDYADYLADVGYEGFTRAHGLGNNDLHPSPSPLPAEHYVDAWTATRTLAHLEAHREKRKEQPFFMWTSFVKPHPPYDPPRPYDQLYDPREIPPPLGDASARDRRSPVLRRHALSHGMQFLSPQAVQVMRAYYYGMVTFQDEMIGRLVHFLNDSGLRDDTIVVYASDHGDLLGDFGGCFKCTFLNGSVRVPLIINAPGAVAEPGRPSDELVGLQDILPTLAGLTGIELPHPMHGRDLAPTLDRKGGVRDLVISQCLDAPWQSVMACDGRWKYSYCEANGYEELYDLASDPNESVNLLERDEDKEQAARLRAAAIEWCKKYGDTNLLSGDDFVRTPVSLEAHSEFSARGMGWRWY